MPVLMVEASDDSMAQWWKGKFTLAEHHERLQVVPQLEIVRVEDAGHMLHHDQPQQLAELIERFL
jgi:pimeloyl-ACP methyl ester carboxylesterase